MTPTPQVTASEAKFISDARAYLPSAVLAGPGTDDEILTIGHQACKGMDLYPHDGMAATRWVYPAAAGSPSGITYYHELAMVYAANDLCPEHSDMWANF